ncbi:protein fmp42 [Anaeramoeba flamelloides]|uniref:Protein fmp42 n=1 Tax=Anaeramoeba flamelloides TaxID=1746091 RepID=A0AAV8A954_9EUKA|nr:protein fmp42 [Anaeramoeba flamelloides]
MSSSINSKSEGEPNEENKQSFSTSLSSEQNSGTEKLDNQPRSKDTFSSNNSDHSNSTNSENNISTQSNSNSDKNDPNLIKVESFSSEEALFISELNSDKSNSDQSNSDKSNSNTSGPDKPNSETNNSDKSNSDQSDNGNENFSSEEANSMPESNSDKSKSDKSNSDKINSEKSDNEKERFTSDETTSEDEDLSQLSREELRERLKQKRKKLKAYSNKIQSTKIEIQKKQTKIGSIIRKIDKKKKNILDQKLISKNEIKFESISNNPNSAYFSRGGFSQLFKRFSKQDKNYLVFENFFFTNFYDRWGHLDKDEIISASSGILSKLYSKFEKAWQCALNLANLGGINETVKLAISSLDQGRGSELIEAKLTMNQSKILFDETAKGKTLIYSARWGSHLKLYLDINNLKVLYLVDTKRKQLVTLIPNSLNTRRTLAFCFLIFNFSHGKSLLIGKNPKVQYIEKQNLKTNVFIKLDKMPKEYLKYCESYYNLLQNSKKTKTKNMKKIKLNIQKMVKYSTLKSNLKKYWENKLVTFPVALCVKRHFPFAPGWLKIDVDGVSFGFGNGKKSKKFIVYNADFEINEFENDTRLFDLIGISLSEKKRLDKIKKNIETKNRKKKSSVVRENSATLQTKILKFPIAAESQKDRELIIIVSHLFYERKRLQLQDSGFNAALEEIHGLLEKYNVQIEESQSEDSQYSGVDELEKDSKKDSKKEKGISESESNSNSDDNKSNSESNSDNKPDNKSESISENKSESDFNFDDKSESYFNSENKSKYSSENNESNSDSKSVKGSNSGYNKSESDFNSDFNSDYNKSESGFNSDTKLNSDTESNGINSESNDLDNNSSLEEQEQNEIKSNSNSNSNSKKKSFDDIFSNNSSDKDESSPFQSEKNSNPSSSFHS